MFPISFHKSHSNILLAPSGWHKSACRRRKARRAWLHASFRKIAIWGQYGAMWCNALQCTALYWIHCSNYVYRILTYSVAFNQIRKLTQLVLWSIRLLHCDVTYFMNSIFKLISPNCFEGELFEKSLFWCNAVQCGAMHQNVLKMKIYQCGAMQRIAVQWRDSPKFIELLS